MFLVNILRADLLQTCNAMGVRDVLTIVAGLGVMGVRTRKVNCDFMRDVVYQSANTFLSYEPLLSIKVDFQEFCLFGDDHIENGVTGVRFLTDARHLII